MYNFENSFCPGIALGLIWAAKFAVRLLENIKHFFAIIILTNDIPIKEVLKCVSIKLKRTFNLMCSLIFFYSSMQ